MRVLDAVARIGGLAIETREGLLGGCAIDATGNSFPDATRALVLEATPYCSARSGGPRWSDPAAKERPEQGLLAMRAALGVYANLRPVTTHPSLYGASPLKPERLAGVDLMVVRELTGGIYFGEKTRSADSASDLCIYSRTEIERLLRIGGRPGAPAAQESHLGRQGQRAGNLAPVALRRHASCSRASSRTCSSNTCSSTPPPCTCCRAPPISTSS